MTFRVWSPIPPNCNLRLLSDQERKVVYEPKQPKRAVWDLAGMQQGLKADPPLRVTFSVSSGFDMRELLKWNEADALTFLSLLTPGHFRGTSWCHMSKTNETPYPADWYTMGFSRTVGAENQKLTPWAYIKFSAIGPNFDRLHFFSAHPEGHYEGT